MASPMATVKALIGQNKRKKIFFFLEKNIKNYLHQRRLHSIGWSTSKSAIFGQNWLDGLNCHECKRCRTKLTKLKDLELNWHKCNRVKTFLIPFVFCIGLVSTQPRPIRKTFYNSFYSWKDLGNKLTLMRRPRSSKSIASPLLMNARNGEK